MAKRQIMGAHDVMEAKSLDKEGLKIKKYNKNALDLVSKINTIRKVLQNLCFNARISVLRLFCIKVNFLRVLHHFLVWRYCHLDRF